MNLAKCMGYHGASLFLQNVLAMDKDMRCVGKIGNQDERFS